MLGSSTCTIWNRTLYDCVSVHRSLVAQGRFGLKSTVPRVFATKTVAFGAPECLGWPARDSIQSDLGSGGFPHATVYKSGIINEKCNRKYKVQSTILVLGCVVCLGRISLVENHPGELFSNPLLSQDFDQDTYTPQTRIVLCTLYFLLHFFKQFKIKTIKLILVCVRATDVTSSCVSTVRESV